jgi:hypothetical protein
VQVDGDSRHISAALAVIEAAMSTVYSNYDGSDDLSDLSPLERACWEAETGWLTDKAVARLGLIEGEIDACGYRQRCRDLDALYHRRIAELNGELGPPQDLLKPANQPLPVSAEVRWSRGRSRYGRHREDPDPDPAALKKDERLGVVTEALVPAPSLLKEGRESDE